MGFARLRARDSAVVIAFISVFLSLPATSQWLYLNLKLKDYKTFF